METRLGVRERRLDSPIPKHHGRARLFFRHLYDRVVIHLKNAEIINAIRLGEAAITRLEGVGWLQLSRENWDQ